MQDAVALSRDDAALPWPSALLHAIDRERDANSSPNGQMQSATEITIIDFNKSGLLNQRTGQIFWNMARHELFDPKDISSET